MSFRRLLLLLACAATGFLLTSATVHRLVPPPPTTLSTKLADFLQSADDYTTVFVGASTVFRQIDPTLFDSELRHAGRHSRSYNLGFPGLTIDEATHLVHVVLDRRPARLRYVFLDVGWYTGEELWNRHSARFAAWHDLRTSLLSIAAMWSSGESVGWRLSKILVDVRAALTNLTAAGALSERGFSESNSVGVGDAGFTPLELSNQAERHRKFLEVLPEYRQVVADVRASGVEDERFGNYARVIIDDLAAELEAHQITLILVRAANVAKNPSPKETLPFIDFMDPDRYPELYDPEARFDGGHQNWKGARIYTRLLARRFLEWSDAVR